MQSDMQSIHWIASLQEWLTESRLWLDRENIRAEVVGVTPYVPSSIHVEFFSECYEATVQLWENGLSDFHVADFRASDLDPDYQVEVTHYEFQSEGEMSAALDGLIKRMAGDNKPSVEIEGWPLVGYSETVYIDPFVGEPLSTHAAKRKSK